MKVYLAVLQTDTYEWIAFSDTEAQAKQSVFDGFNTYLKRQFEFENKFSIETTHEYLEDRLKHYYRVNYGGPVSIDTLTKAWDFYVLDLDKNDCYRDGFKVPRRVQDI